MRRSRDSNPGCGLTRMLVFQTSAFDLSATPPNIGIVYNITLWKEKE